MPTMPTSFSAGYEPSADDYQAMLDALNALVNLTSPTGTTSNGTTTSGTTETYDAVLGNYIFSVPANSGGLWRYEVCYTGRLQGSVNGDTYELRVRDGGASTPTNASTQVGNTGVYVPLAGGAGTFSVFVRNTFVFSAGTHTLGLFLIRTNGTGTATSLAPTSANRELYVRFVGTT